MWNIIRGILILVLWAFLVFSDCEETYEESTEYSELPNRIQWDSDSDVFLED